jgi:hypothetical protein
MNSVLRNGILVLMLVVAGIASARTMKAKSGKAYIRLVEAYTQVVNSGRDEGTNESSQQIVIEWRSKSVPETFFWRGENGWLTCQTEKAHKITGSRAGIPDGMVYRTEEIMINEIKRGDTILLTPIRGGKFPIPAEIPEKAKNTLFFKAGGNSWLSFPVGKITKKRAVSMP